MVEKKKIAVDSSKSVGLKLDPTDSISVELRKARDSKGLSFSDLHRETGISRTTLHDYESGRSKPGAREIKLLCDALQITPNVLIYGTEEPFRNQGRLHNLLNISNEDVKTARLAMLLMTLGKAEKDAWITILGESLKARVGDKLDQTLDVIEAATAMIVDDFADALREAMPDEKVAAVGKKFEAKLETLGKKK